MVERLALRVKP